MIIELLFGLLKGFVMIVLNLFDLLPALPLTITTNLNSFFTVIFGYASLVSFFFPLDIAILLLTLYLAIENFDDIYKITMFVLKKIPFINIG